ncbi:hypothetical protein EW146_g5994 [Bondarzewia mesenterica]|uniref:Uncharacterized protein n=1 Tax=Bondarzewia mesenterica TaxID=1095465 RepID=A0A4S4LPT6_9AGAM|nr:hypothetical protein EW146_g5994 [Bondarzewia mesenterica]
MTYTTTLFSVHLSDAVLVWRAWGLWDRKIKVIIVLSLTCFAMAIVGFASAGFDIRSLKSGVLMQRPFSPTLLPILAYLLSLFTNILATSLITFKAWKYSRSINAYLGNSSPTNIKVGAILALLVESGFLYCAVWIVFFVSLFSQNSSFKAAMQVIMVQISGIYPTVVIVLVSLQKTAWDMTASIEGVQSVYEMTTGPPPAIRISLSMNDQPNPPSSNSRQVQSPWDKA